MVLIEAVKDGNLDVVKFILEKKLELVDVRDFVYDSTSLIIASDRGHTEIVKELLKNGANINSKDKEGDTALIRASYNGRIEVVKELLKNGASSTELNKKGETALGITIKSLNTTNYSLSDPKREIINLLTTKIESLKKLKESESLNKTESSNSQNPLENIQNSGIIQEEGYTGIEWRFVSRNNYLFVECRRKNYEPPDCWKIVSKFTPSGDIQTRNAFNAKCIN